MFRSRACCRAPLAWQRREHPAMSIGSQGQGVFCRQDQLVPSPRPRPAWCPGRRFSDHRQAVRSDGWPPGTRPSRRVSPDWSSRTGAPAPHTVATSPRPSRSGSGTANAPTRARSGTCLWGARTPSDFLVRPRPGWPPHGLCGEPLRQRGGRRPAKSRVVLRRRAESAGGGVERRAMAVQSGASCSSRVNWVSSVKSSACSC